MRIYLIIGATALFALQAFNNKGECSSCMVPQLMGQDECPTGKCETPVEEVKTTTEHIVE